jgi:hypothetical protein
MPQKQSPPNSPPPPTARQPEITAAMCRLDSAVSANETAAGIIDEKIGPICRELAPSEDKEMESVGTVKLAVVINALASRIEHINTRLVDLSRRVEL